MCVIHPVDAAFLYACMYAVQLFALAVVRMHAPVPFGDTLLFLQEFWCVPMAMVL